MPQAENKTNTKQHWQIIAVILIFIVGLSLRIANLGQLPLNEVEAALALDAKGLLTGQEQFSQPFYTIITSTLFWLFEDHNFFARFVPAIIGSLLILAPWVMGRTFSTRNKMLLSFGLAFDPALIAASKTAGSPIIAVASLFFLLILFYKKKPIGVGIVLALLFMSGPAALFGGILYGLALFWVLLRDEAAAPLKECFRDFSWKPMLISFVVSYVLISTSFFIHPGGIGAAFKGISTTVPQTTDLGILGVAIALLLYEGFPFIIAIVGRIKQRKNADFIYRFSTMLVVLGLVMVLVSVLFNLGGIALDLVWVSIPLWILAAYELDQWVDGLSEIQSLSLVISVFFLLMLGFILFTYVGAVNVEAVNVALNYEGAQQKLLLRSLLVVGGILLVGISYFLSAYTWDVGIARNALMLGGGVYLLIFGLFTQTWHSAYLGSQPSAEIWHQSATLVDATLMTETIEDISEMNHGQRIQQSITVVGLDSPALLWLLRDQDITNTPALTSQDAPEMILTNLIDAQYWGAEYTGQDFRLRSTPNWSWLTLQEWLSWTIYHKVDVTTDEMVILWVRTDLFPGQGSGE